MVHAHGTLSKVAGLLFTAVLAAGCGDDATGPTGPTAIVDADFAAELGIDLATYTAKPSGVYYTDVVVGEGEVAQDGDQVVVDLEGGWLVDGSRFQQFFPDFGFTIGAQDVIAGFGEGVLGMQVGGRRIFIVPSSLAYGSEGVGPIPPYAIVIFQVSLTAVSS